MRKLLHGIRQPSNWFWLLPIGLFLALAHLFPQNKVAIVTNGLDIGVWLFILRAYGPPFFMQLRSDKPHPEINLFGGILLMSTALAASRIWSQVIIMLDKPVWMLNHWFQSFCYLLVALGMFYLIKIPGYSKSRGYIMGALAIAVMVISLGLAYLE